MLVCPRCGRKSTDVPFFQAFCVDCYPFRLEVPRGIEFPHCRDCDRILFRGIWQRVAERELATYILGKCKGEFDEADYSTGDGLAVFCIRKGGQDLKIERTIPIAYPAALCPDCSRRRGGYFEAILQIRGPASRVASFAKRAARWFEKNSFIGKVDENKDGIDIYVGSSKVALAFVQTLGIHYTLTRKLFGKKEGKRIYRTTLAIRLD